MICCVTGHRPKGFPFLREEGVPAYEEYRYLLQKTVLELIHDGYDHFITGMANGVDIDFANAVLYAKERLDYAFITLEAALPYPISIPKVPSEYHDACSDILECCSKTTVVSPRYYKGCMHKRNQYMVNNSDLVLAVWNEEHRGGTWETIKYAYKREKPIRYIMLKKMGGFQSYCFEKFDNAREDES